MGFNPVQGAATAQGFGGLTNVGQSAQASLAAQSASTNLTAAAQAIAGFGGFQQSLYQSQVTANAAKQAQRNAAAAIEGGQYEESVQKLRTGEAVGQQLADQGASGIDVASRSSVAARQSTATVGALDAAMIHFNAARQAQGEEEQADALKAQSRLEKMSAVGSLAEGGFKVASTLIGGASSLGEKYSRYRLSGAVT